MTRHHRPACLGVHPSSLTQSPNSQPSATADVNFTLPISFDNAQTVLIQPRQTVSRQFTNSALFPRPFTRRHTCQLSSYVLSIPFHTQWYFYVFIDSASQSQASRMYRWCVPDAKARDVNERLISGISKPLTRLRPPLQVESGHGLHGELYDPAVHPRAPTRAGWVRRQPLRPGDQDRLQLPERARRRDCRHRAVHRHFQPKSDNSDRFT